MFYRFLIKLFETLVSVICILTVVFFLVRALPGNSYEHEQNLNSVVLEQLQNSKLEKSILESYKEYVLNTLTLNWGESETKPGVRVTDIVFESLGRTFKVVFIAVIFISLVSFLVLYALYTLKSNVLRNFISLFNLCFISLPGLFLAPLMIFIFAIKLEWLPVALLETPLHYVLPVLCLSLRPLALMMRQLMLEIDEKKLSDYVRTGVAKGLSVQSLVIRYYFKPSLVTWISILTTTLIGLISGNFLVEYLFSIPGLGSLFIHSLEQRDIKVLIALIFVFSGVIILLSKMSDLILSRLNPLWNNNPESR